MIERIRVGIVGYGNLGKGVEKAMSQNSDFELVCIFTNRLAEQVQIQTNTLVVDMASVEKYRDKIDIMFMCGGSATDLPKQVPKMAKLFNTVDAYDNHAQIPHYYKEVDRAARQGDKLSMISTGWDPGFYSVVRVIMESGIPMGKNYTIPGTGVSQGHSDAIRRIKGGTVSNTQFPSRRAWRMCAREVTSPIPRASLFAAIATWWLRKTQTRRRLSGRL